MTFRCGGCHGTMEAEAFEFPEKVIAVIVQCQHCGEASVSKRERTA